MPAPKSWKSRAARPSTGGASTTRLPPEVRTNPTSGRARARSVTASATWAASVASARRNLRRAGTPPNRSRTSTVVPRGCPASLTWTGFPCRTSTSVPAGPESSRVRRIRWDTLAMDGRASPRKPWVATACEVLEGPELGGGVALDRKSGVLPAHARAVVPDADQRLAARLDLDARRCGPRRRGRSRRAPSPPRPGAPPPRRRRSC